MVRSMVVPKFYKKLAIFMAEIVLAVLCFLVIMIVNCGLPSTYKVKLPLFSQGGLHTHY
ncbi:hypothetical protein OTK01_000818 [Caldicellulosiruptor acetigenus]|uniref:hypothetical protein n=1 Tax=Caldicellulosiruptor acetigenus TaxID=301953 RepID=UPI0022A98750|nr:hypothetical protein [Caldicellulosiruptor acetigenus]WAM37003.1 hypothetical protein OTK01_000818 [Caldicellulosiruptor acetigenus]